MDCPYIPDLSYSEFGERLRSRLNGQRAPLAGSLELTFRCNLRCQHCYVSCGHQGLPGMQELSADEIAGILDQIADAGALWLLITGGEPLLRRDFPEIWTYAKRKGFLLTLFTNGTLLDERTADLLAEWPPVNMEITLYGATPETYERVTGNPHAYLRVHRAIELLLERKLPLKLKTMVMTLNRHELTAMRDFAHSLDLDFRFDAALNGGLEGFDRPKQLRISPEEVVQLDLEDPERSREWPDLMARFLNIQIDSQYLYHCGAGIRGFHIDPYGELSLCLMARQPGYDLRQGTFQEGWSDFLLKARMQTVEDHIICNECQLAGVCHHCPGWAMLEHGNPHQPVEFLCQVARLRTLAFTEQPIAIPNSGLEISQQPVSQ